MKRRCLVLAFGLSLLFSATSFAAPKKELPPKAKNFIEYMVKRYHFDRNELINTLSQVHYDDQVVFHVVHPYEQKPWNVYRARFITQKRVDQGLAYWKKHEAALKYAQEHYGVPPSVIVSIIGVETNYGEIQGDYSALTALSTLAFYRESRSAFFTQELAELFLLTHENEIPILTVKSSYAGAIGIPQFMPSVYRHYAVNYQNVNAHPNLMSNDDDAIVSIANYLSMNGWHKNEPITTPFDAPKSLNPSLISKNAVPRLSMDKIKSLGIQPVAEVMPDQKAAIVELRNETNREHWLTFHNFRVIMSYNPRIIYAMAVYQLSQVIEKLHDQKPTRTSSRTAPARITERSPQKLSAGA